MSVTIYLPSPICLHYVDVNNYTVAENCQHLQAELKACDQSFHFPVQNLAFVSFQKPIIVACRETKTIWLLSIVL